MMMREREGRVILMVALPKAGVGQGQRAAQYGKQITWVKLFVFSSYGEWLVSKKYFSVFQGFRIKSYGV